MKIFFAWLFLSSMAGAARAQTAWPPPIPELPKIARPPAGRTIAPDVIDAVVGKMVQYDFHGLGAEAARLQAWAKNKGALALGTTAMTDESGGTHAVSPEMATALKRAAEYFAMTDPTRAELVASAMSAEGVARIKALFEGAISQRLTIPTGTVVPEIGGMAVIEGGLQLREIPEQTRPAMRELAKNAGDVTALAALYARLPDQMKAIDEQGLLAKLLQRWPDWEARGTPQADRDRILKITVDGLLRNASDAYIFDPATQFSAVVSQDWSGGYVGLWHIHPPQTGKSGWGPGDIPSGNDMDIASTEGQNLVVAFSPDGFDLYDLSKLSGDKKPDLSKVLQTTYRSAAWRTHFQALFDQAFPK